MTADPFDVLRVTDQRTAPDAGFARRLKARVASALILLSPMTLRSVPGGFIASAYAGT